MSDTDSLGIPNEVVQVAIDSLVESVILQAFVTGLYTLLFVQAIVPLIRQKSVYFSGVLTALYIAIVLNLAGSWDILRSVVVTNNETRDSMAFELFAGPIQIPKMANATGSIAILLADGLLAWRCYILWQRSKWILAMFSFLILGEFAVLPIYLVLNVALGPHQVTIVVLYFIISAGITSLATGLIVYRIVNVSRRSHNETTTYQYTIELLVESGVLYTGTVVITAILLAIQGNGLSNLGVVQAASYFGALLTPITGIAPTLITARVFSGHARPDAEWSQPVSTGIIFKTQNYSEHIGGTQTDATESTIPTRVGLSMGTAAESRTIVNQEKSSQA